MEEFNDLDDVDFIKRIHDISKSIDSNIDELDAKINSIHDKITQINNIVGDTLTKLEDISKL